MTQTDPGRVEAADRGAGLCIRKGTAYILFCFDLGQEIELDTCRRLVKEAIEPVRFQHTHRTPRDFRFHPEPLRLLRRIDPIALGHYQTTETIEVVMYDFGAASVLYSVPIRGPLDALVELSCRVVEAHALKDDAKIRATELLDVIRTAVRKPGLSDVVEDYFIIVAHEIESEVSPEDILRRHGPDIARLLRAEREALSVQEVEDSLHRSASFSHRDLTIVDWNAALVIDPEPEDVCSVLEFANVELLEMRFLDRQLDNGLDEAYELLVPRRTPIFGVVHPALRRVGRMQVEGAILFERVDNALKLIGDQFLARVYRLASERFRLTEWNAGILRKLETIDGIYAKLQDRAATLRFEMLEWIIIVLIALSIVLPFIT